MVGGGKGRPPTETEKRIIEENQFEARSGPAEGDLFPADASGYPANLICFVRSQRRNAIKPARIIAPAMIKNAWFWLGCQANMPLLLSTISISVYL